MTNIMSEWIDASPVPKESTETEWLFQWAVFKECMDTAGADVHMIYGVNVKDMKASKLVNALHDFTSMAIGSETAEQYGIAVGAVFEWIRAQGMEPEAILMRKHRYNTTRPYKHGKKF